MCARVVYHHWIRTRWQAVGSLKAFASLDAPSGSAQAAILVPLRRPRAPHPRRHVSVALSALASAHRCYSTHHRARAVCAPLVFAARAAPGRRPRGDTVVIQRVDGDGEAVDAQAEKRLRLEVADGDYGAATGEKERACTPLRARRSLVS